MTRNESASVEKWKDTSTQMVLQLKSLVDPLTPFHSVNGKGCILLHSACFLPGERINSLRWHEWRFTLKRRESRFTENNYNTRSVYGIKRMQNVTFLYTHFSWDVKKSHQPSWTLSLQVVVFIIFNYFYSILRCYSSHSWVLASTKWTRLERIPVHQTTIKPFIVQTTFTLGNLLESFNVHDIIASRLQMVME